MIIDIENPELETPLQNLKSLVLSEGGFLHPGATLSERAGNFDVLSVLNPSDRSSLFKIPESCLPRLNSFKLSASGDDIYIRDVTPGTPSVKVRSMELMLEIYRISYKLANVRNSCPWFSLARYPEVIRQLLELREGSSKFEERQRFMNNGQYDDLLLSCFMGTRTFKMPGQDCHVLMPFIDYINHHHAASGFAVRNDNGTTFLCSDNSLPCSDSAGVRVSYFQMLDPVDSWLNYHFIDESVPIVKSLPLVIDIGSGREIRVKAFSVGRKQAAPKQLKDLAPFLPAIIDRSDRHLTVSRLIVPHDRAPLALRRILAVLVRTIAPELGANSVKSTVENAESQLLVANVRFYSKLSSTAAGLMKECPADPGLAEVVKISGIQLGKLSAYRQRIANMS